eukprot:CAMPEP_0177607480 /NCGR_PEP_ID=MMETSP0419_2-20121207/17941_1 /TAXON_ID=582737 /ORGANISM="Tetraselmis sp., Strain GSL018" /LENGTH=107 /DNA_ID=CAMNT_0019102067 /DNA_START=510 /DNA_END=829 /DNA_ORIENTATION=+
MFQYVAVPREGPPIKPSWTVSLDNTQEKNLLCNPESCKLKHYWKRHRKAATSKFHGFLNLSAVQSTTDMIWKRHRKAATSKFHGFLNLSAVQSTTDMIWKRHRKAAT